jgi:phytoene/squalene synthetase
MALGNIKVDRTAVISRIEAVVKDAEKVVKDGEKAQPALDKAAEKAQADVNKVAQTAFASASAETVDVNIHHWSGRVNISVSLVEDAAEKVKAAQNSANDANNAASVNRHEVAQAEQIISDGKRDLNLLNASSELTINVKTAGFLGYFGG